MKTIRTLGLLAFLMVAPSMFAAPVTKTGLDTTFKAAAGAALGAASSYLRNVSSETIVPALEDYLITKIGEGKWRNRIGTLATVTLKLAHFVGYEVAREYVASLVDGADEEQVAARTSRVSALLGLLYLNRSNIATNLVDRKTTNINALITNAVVAESAPKTETKKDAPKANA